jgi:solute:Na+ symporter, SSS family
MPYLLDALVILGYFALIIGIGLSQRSKSGSVEGFTLGDRQIAWWAVLASIFAAEISAGTFFGAPGEGYALRNYTYIQLMAGYLLARVVVSAVLHPSLLPATMCVVSVYEFLEARFGPTHPAPRLGGLPRHAASWPAVPACGCPPCCWCSAGRCSSIRPSTPMQEFWLYAAGARSASRCSLRIYTALGGIRAVIWTDVIQVVILFSALGFSSLASARAHRWLGQH